MNTALQFAAIAMIVTSTAFAQPPDQEAWRRFATPGPAHEAFAEFVGDWKTKTTLYIPNPDDPQVSEGTAKFELLMGGRYLKQTFQGQYRGAKFEGMGITGYDNALKKYVTTWIDNFGTGIMNGTGELDEESNTITEIAEASTPAGPMKVKTVSQYRDADHFTVTMYMLLPGDQEVKHMQIEYTRK